MFSLEAKAGNKLGTPEVVDDAVKNIAEKKSDKGHFLLPKGEARKDDDEYEGAKAGLGLPVDVLETGITNRADHEPGDQ